MPAAKKRRHPANDTRPLSSHRMSYVVLSRPYWNEKRLAVLGVLLVFVAILALSMAGPFSKIETPAISAAPQITVEPQTIAAIPAEQPKPQPQQTYDIKIDASALAPTEQLTSLAEMLPPSAVQSSTPHTVPQSETNEQDEDRTAAGQAAFARRLADAGAINQALRAQHRAAELEPGNMLYRLQLAILYDRADHPESAAVLYKQVMQAYENNDRTLPRAIGIEGIRRRVAYLAATAPQ